MDTTYELESVKQLMRAMVTEVDNIADGLTMDFKGIQADKCATYLRKLALGYRMAVRELEMIEVSQSAE